MKCQPTKKKKTTPHERDVAALSASQARDTTLTEKILQKVEHVMATVNELKAAILAVSEDIKAEKTEVQGKLTTLLTEIQELKDQLAAGTGVTPADLDELVTSVNAIATGVKDISEPEAPPA